MTTVLSPETQRRVDLLFRAADRAAVTALLIEQCSNNLPFLERLDEYQLERVHFAALKLSAGDVDRLLDAIALAQLDWRDLLMAAGFGHNITMHKLWLPGAPERQADEISAT